MDKVFPAETLDEIRFVSLYVRYQGDWVLAHHRTRGSWECPGGHVEPGEEVFDAAVRELYEETGAADFMIMPVFDYSHYDETGVFCNNGRTFFIDVQSFLPLPDNSEMDKIVFCPVDALPEPFTYDLEETRANLTRAEKLSKTGTRRVYQDRGYRFDRTYTRIDVLIRELDAMLLNNPDDFDRRSGYVHLYGVGLAAAMIALKRGYDTAFAELAEMAGLLHDYISYFPCSNMAYDKRVDHARRCAPVVRELLERLEITTPEETDRICTAVYNHSDKNRVDAPLDEIVKDADVLQHWLRNPMEPVFKDQERVAKLCREFSFAGAGTLC